MDLAPAHVRGEALLEATEVVLPLQRVVERVHAAEARQREPAGEYETASAAKSGIRIPSCAGSSSVQGGAPASGVPIGRAARPDLSRAAAARTLRARASRSRSTSGSTSAAPRRRWGSGTARAPSTRHERLPTPLSGDPHADLRADRGALPGAAGGERAARSSRSRAVGVSMPSPLDARARRRAEPAEPAELARYAGAAAARGRARPAGRDRERRQRGGAGGVALRGRARHARHGLPHHVHGRRRRARAGRAAGARRRLVGGRGRAHPRRMGRRAVQLRPARLPRGVHGRRGLGAAPGPAHPARQRRGAARGRPGARGPSTSSPPRAKEMPSRSRSSRASTTTWRAASSSIAFTVAPERIVLGTIPTAAGEELCLAPRARAVPAPRLAVPGRADRDRAVRARRDARSARRHRGGARRRRDRALGELCARLTVGLEAGGLRTARGVSPRNESSCLASSCAERCRSCARPRGCG